MKEISSQILNVISMTTTPKSYEREINILNNYKNICITLGLYL